MFLRCSVSLPLVSFRIFTFLCDWQFEILRFRASRTAADEYNARPTCFRRFSDFFLFLEIYCLLDIVIFDKQRIFFAILIIIQCFIYIHFRWGHMIYLLTYRITYGAGVGSTFHAWKYYQIHLTRRVLYFIKRTAVICWVTYFYFQLKPPRKFAHFRALILPTSSSTPCLTPHLATHVKFYYCASYNCFALFYQEPARQNTHHRYYWEPQNKFFISY